MISTAPVAVASSLLTVADKARAFVAAAKSAAVDGLTVGEFGELTVALLRVAMATVDSLPVDGAQKKAWVIEAVALLFDELADKAVPAIAWPLWIVFKPAIRSLVLAAAGGAVESLLPLVRIAA